MSKIKDLVYSKEVLDFVKSCKNFVDLLEVTFPEERKSFIIELLQVLPGIYRGIMILPPNQPVLDLENEKFVTEENWSEIYRKVAGIMGSQNEYLDLPDKDEFDRLDVVSRELSEDLSDIYQDIKDFTEVFKIGNEDAMNDILWECRINFENYWGKKLLRACLNLHKIMIRDEEILEKMDMEFTEKSTNKEYRADEWFISRRQNEEGEAGGIQE